MGAGRPITGIDHALIGVRDLEEASNQMREGSEVFIVVDGEPNGQAGLNRHRVSGRLSRVEERWLATFDNRTEGERAQGAQPDPGRDAPAAGRRDTAIRLARRAPVRQ